MSKKPKIGVIGLKGLPAFGGAAAVGEYIIDQLKDKYDFTVYSVESHTVLTTGNYNGYKQIVFRAISNKKINILLYYFKAAFHAVFVANYNIIHVHHSDSAFLLPILRIRYKTIVTTHGAHNSGMLEKWKKFRWFFQGQIKLLFFSNKLSCVSLKEKEWLRENYSFDVAFIPNGINLFQGIASDNKKYDIFFGAGRIIRDKGGHILLKALNRIRFGGSVFFAGDLSQSPEYTKELKALSENLNVHFAGLIKDKNQLLSIISASKIFIFPSLKEAMSMMLLEGASTETPIICSDIRENKDVFSEKEVLFFKTNDHEDLGEKIEFAFSNHLLMKEKSKNALQKVIVQNNWNSIAMQYSKMYSDLLK